MNAPKFTQGKWKVNLKTRASHFMVFPHVEGHPTKSVALVEIRKDRAEAEANAALIAAAPEMYKVLSQLDSRGGLGLDIHEWIQTTLSTARGEQI